MDTTEEAPTNAQLAEELDRLRRRIDQVGNGLTAVTVVAAVMLIIAVAVQQLWPGPKPTTADEDLADLMTAGPHCYTSSEEMAAARQRALTAIDRVEWERDFTRRWEEEHRTEVKYPVTEIPPNAAPSVTSPPFIPSIVRPADPRVPNDPDVDIDEALCFGVTGPTTD